jgi:hypothetical protein
MAKAQQPEKPTFRMFLKQLPSLVREAAGGDKRFIPLILAVILVPILVGVGLLLLGLGWAWLVAGVLFAATGFLFTLTRRVEKVRIDQIEGEPGAGAIMVQRMRGDWRLHQAMASTTDFDMVHAIVCRAGVILLADVGKSGNPNRVRSLIGQEKRRLSKIIGSVELREYIVGDEEGQLPLRKIRSTLMRLPHTITGKEVNALDARVTAIAARPQLPKGAIPKNMRPSKGAFRASRGR